MRRSTHRTALGFASGSEDEDETQAKRRAHQDASERHGPSHESEDEDKELSDSEDDDETRLDPKDGVDRTRREFIAQYGEHGRYRWRHAGHEL
eukprot:COSAG01_NODE_22778_length_841_cov_1.588949_2_plen_92_part_01